MRHLGPATRRLLWLACACVLLLPHLVAAAEPSLSADFDGDGRRDRVTVDRHEPSVLHIWLSETQTTSIIRTSTPVLRVVAMDLDGDHRSELIARGSNAGLQVWTKKRKGFRSYRPASSAPGSLTRPVHHQVDDGPTDAPSAIPWSGSPTVALLLVPQPRAPSFATHAVSRAIDVFAESVLPLAASAPRPPPFRSHL
jgi:hypothetical protein